MTTKWHYRVTVAQRFDHLPESVQPTTAWIEAPSLRQAKRAVQKTVHIVAQVLGRGTDTGGTWRVEGPTRDAWRFDLYHSHFTPSLAIVGEVRRAP